MEVVYQHANESRLNYNVPKGKPLHQVWNSLWEQCEEANERSNSQKACFPKANKNLANILKMLAVFQSEVEERSRGSNSEHKTSDADLCENCGSSKSSQKLLEENYKRRGEIIEHLLSESTATSAINEGLKGHAYQMNSENVSVEMPNETKEYTNNRNVICATPRTEMAKFPLLKSSSLATNGLKNVVFDTFSYKEDRKGEISGGRNMHGYQPNVANIHQPRLTAHSLEKEAQIKGNTTKTLVDFLANFTKYDPSKDPFTNMSVFENECSQHNLGPRESCLMMKLWLPSKMSARLAAPVASPAGGPHFWSNDFHWGDTLDRVKALTHLVTGEDYLGTEILEALTVTSQDDPWEFARKFEQAYRLVMNVQDPKPTPALLKALINKFSFVDRITHVAASKEKTIEGIVRLVESYQRHSGLKAAPFWINEGKSIRDIIPKDEQPIRWGQVQNHNCSCSESPASIEGEQIGQSH